MIDGGVTYHDALTPLMVDIDTIRPHPDNYNHGDINRITESIRTSGMYRPVYTQRSTGTIIAGNHTWFACKQLGATRIPVITVDADDTTAHRILIADNRIAALAEPDNTQLLELLNRLDGELAGTGYDRTDLDVLERIAAADNYLRSDWQTDAAAAFYDDADIDDGTTEHTRAHHVLRIKTETETATIALFRALGIRYDAADPRREIWYPIGTAHYRPPDRYTP